MYPTTSGRACWQLRQGIPGIPPLIPCRPPARVLTICALPVPPVPLPAGSGHVVHDTPVPQVPAAVTPARSSQSVPVHLLGGSEGPARAASVRGAEEAAGGRLWPRLGVFQTCVPGSSWARVRAKSIGAVLLRVHGDVGRHRRRRRRQAGDARRRPRRLRGSGDVEEPGRSGHGRAAGEPQPRRRPVRGDAFRTVRRIGSLFRLYSYPAD